tara:strand:- start:101 stop:211 length:111 start_codon:yes stop_codon:yes gene_type:complete
VRHTFLPIYELLAYLVQQRLDVGLRDPAVAVGICVV